MCGSAESSLTVHTLPMALLLLSYGQNFYQVPLQRAWESWLGYNGNTRVHYPLILDVLSAEAGGHWKPSNCQLGHGQLFCRSSLLSGDTYT